MTCRTKLVDIALLLTFPTFATAQVVIRTHVPDTPQMGSLGHEVAALGDVNGDGVDDYAIAAPAAMPGTTFASGAVHVYSGATGAKLSTIQGTLDYQYLGSSIDAAGDVNADGRLDLVIGEKFGLIGAVSVYSARPPALIWRLAGTPLGGVIGRQVKGAGDLDGNGKDDVLSNRFVADPESFSVVAYDGPTGAALFTASGVPGFGSSIDGGADLTGDGVPEILVGIPNATTGAGSNAGRVELWEFGAASPRYVVDGTQPGARFGYHVSFGGDVDGDGTRDFAVQAIDEDNPVIPSIREGAIHAFEGSSGLPLWTHRGRDYQSMYHGEIDFSHDLDGDAVTDVLAGFASEHLADFLGSVRILRGATGEVSSAIVENDLGFMKFLGQSVAAIGDIDLDGRSDFVVGHGSESLPNGAFVYGSVTCSGSAVNFGGSDPSTGTGCVGDVGLQCALAPTFAAASLTGEGCFSADGRALLYTRQATAASADGALLLVSTQLGNSVLPGGCSLLIGPSFPISIATPYVISALPVWVPAAIAPATIYVQCLAWNAHPPMYNCLQVTTTSALKIDFQ